MDLTRRDILAFAGATLAVSAAAAFLPVRLARASTETSRAIAAFTKGAVPVEGGVRIDAPEIADNGGAVPVRVSAKGARRIAVFADSNPSPGVAVFNFGKWITPAASTRIRLARSQKADRRCGNGRRHVSRDLPLDQGDGGRLLGEWKWRNPDRA